MESRRTIRRGLFLAAAVLCIVSVACTAGGNGTTWTASFSDSPYSLESGGQMKAALTLDDALRQTPFWQCSFSGGIAAGCDRANRWAAVGPRDRILLEATQLAGELTDIQEDTDVVIVTTSVARYRIAAGVDAVTLEELRGR